MQYQHHPSATDGFGCITPTSNSNNSPTCSEGDPSWANSLSPSKTTKATGTFSSDISFFPASAADAAVDDIFSSKGFGPSSTTKQKQPSKELTSSSQTNNSKLSIQKSPDGSKLHRRRRHYPRSNSCDAMMLVMSPKTSKKSADPITPRKSSERQRRQRPTSRKQQKSRSRSFTSAPTPSAAAAPEGDTVHKLPPFSPSTPRTRRRKSKSFTSPPSDSSIPPRPTPSPATPDSRSSLQAIVKIKSNKTKMEREFLQFLREKKEYKGTKQQIQAEFFQHLKDKQINQEQQRCHKVQMESELLQFLRHKEQQSYTKHQLEKEFLKCLQQKQSKSQQQDTVVQSPASRHRLVLGKNRSMSVRSLSPSPKVRGLLHGDNDIGRNSLMGKRQMSLRSMVTVKSNKVKMEQELNDLFHVVQHQCPMKEKADIMKQKVPKPQGKPLLLNEKENNLNKDATSNDTIGCTVGGQKQKGNDSSSLPPKSPTLSKFFHKKISAANIKQHASFVPSLPKASEHDMSTDTWRDGGWASGDDASASKNGSNSPDVPASTAEADVEATTASAEELLNMILYGKSGQSSSAENDGADADVADGDKDGQQRHDNSGGRQKLDKTERRRRRLHASRQRRAKKKQESKDCANSSNQDTCFQWVGEGGEVSENIPEGVSGPREGNDATDDEANSIDSFTAQDLVRMDSKATAATTATTGTVSTFETTNSSNSIPVSCGKLATGQHQHDKVTHIRSLAYNSSHHDIANQAENKCDGTVETDGEDNIDGFAYDSTS